MKGRGGTQNPARPDSIFETMDFAAATESVLGNVLDTFAEQIPVVYTPASGSPYSIRGVFDENYQTIDPNSMTMISTTHPVLLVRLSDLDSVPGKGDRVTVRTNRVFTVTKMEPDGRGGALLILHKV